MKTDKNTTKCKEDWEKEFDKKFPKIMGRNKVRGFPREAFLDLKSFISTLIKSKQKETLGKVLDKQLDKHAKHFNKWLGKEGEKIRELEKKRCQSKQCHLLEGKEEKIVEVLTDVQGRYAGKDHYIEEVMEEKEPFFWRINTKWAKETAKEIIKALTKR